MIIKNVRLKFCFLGTALLTLACNPPKTLYLSNRTHQPITFMVDAGDRGNTPRQESIFEDSLQGKRIESGHAIINFGKGDWNETDIESLKAVLARTTVRIGGTDKGYRLPRTIRVAHYRLFVEELLVKIRDTPPEH